MAKRKLKIALVGGPMYDGLYNRIPLFTSRTGWQVEVGVKLIHPELNDHIAKVYAAGRGDYDLIVTHNKYAPSQKQWLLPLNGHLSADEIGAFLPSTMALATIDGDLMGLPRNIDVRLLYYRRDLFEDREAQPLQTGFRPRAGSAANVGRVRPGRAVPGSAAGQVRHVVSGPVLRTVRHMV